MQISLISSIASISSTIARFSPIIPYLERRVSRRVVLSIGNVLRGTLIFSFLFAPDYYTIIILSAGAQFIIGITRAFDEALLIDLTTDEGRAIFYGIRSSFRDVGGILGPIILTTLMNREIRLPFYLASLAIIGNAILYFVTLRARAGVERKPTQKTHPKH
jgi:MFS family permease